LKLETTRTHDHGEGGVDGRADVGAAEVDGHQRLVHDGQDAGLRALGRLPERLVHLEVRVGMRLRLRVKMSVNVRSTDGGATPILSHDCAPGEAAHIGPSCAACKCKEGSSRWF